MRKWQPTRKPEIFGTSSSEISRWAKKQPIMGCKCRAFFSNRRIISFRLLYREKTTFCRVRKQPAFLGEGADHIRYRICSSIYLERAGHGKRREYKANGRNRVRHVAKSGFHMGLNGIFHTALPT